jgi:Ca2+-binding EF-hand superfamily protein
MTSRKTIRLIRTSNIEHPTSNIERRSTALPSFDVGCSMFDVRCSARAQSRRRLTLVALLIGVCIALPAQAQRKVAVPSSQTLPDVEIPTGTSLSSDVQDIVFVDSSRALFIRLHVQVNGLGFRESWDVFTEKFFDYADGDSDGSLNDAEVALGARMLGVSTNVTTMDTEPKDRKVSKKEWTAGLARFGESQFTNANQGNARFFTPDGRMAAGNYNPGSALWKLLDTDRDQVVTKDELSSASRVLAKLDLDDDQVLEATELRPYDVNPYGQYFVTNGTTMAQPEGPTVLVIPARGDLTSFARQLLSRRDGKDKTRKDQKLSPQELALSKDEFAEADVDGNGHLDLEELTQMLRRVKPQLALVVRQGPEAGRRGKFALATVDGKPAPLASSLRGNPRSTVTLDVGTLQLQFSAADWGGPTDYERSYKPQFQSLDQDGNGYLDQKEVENNYGTVFNSMDRDRNKMVFLKEFVDYFRQQNEVAQSRVTLQGNDQGKLLFDLLDSNRDSRLSPRELAEAADRSPQWDRNKDSKLEEAEIPHQYALSVGRGGNQGVYAVAASTALVGGRPTSASSSNAPLWFSKMDRNRDGDLSAREFLGSSETFERLDANRDGMIDAAEASKAAQKEKD